MTSTVKNSPKSKLLTMDLIELTLLLKSIGFRLESIDYDEFRCWHKKSNENGNASMPNSARTDAVDHHINVEISCSKSKIVSNLSMRFNDCETAAAAAGTAVTAEHTQTHNTISADPAAPTLPSQIIACSCPKREPRNANNSFWEVQSSGTFVNQRRSINSLMNPESAIDHDTSSNLLPVLSTKSIALTHVLIQVLLNQYKNNIQFGEMPTAQDVDIKSIMRIIEKINISSILANEKGSSGRVNNHDELNLVTPTSSMNVTPTEDEAPMNVTLPKADDQTASALNDTVNTEAFGSPKSDIFTSSPQGSETTAILACQRDTTVINHLNSARQSIDHALLSMKLNVTRSLTQDITAASTGILSTTTQEHVNDNNRRRNTLAATRMLNGRNNALQASANARPTQTSTTLNRRASLGSNIARMSTVKSSASPALPTSRLKNTSRPNSTERSVSAVASGEKSKLSLVRKAVSGIGNRTIGTIATTVKTTTMSSSSSSSSTTAASIKRASYISRRTSSPAGTVVTNGTPPTVGSGSISRKTTITSKFTSLPSKLVKK